MPGTVLAHANAFRVIAISTEGRRAGRSNPLIATLVTIVLLLESLPQGLEQLLEATKRFDSLPLLLTQ